MCAKFGSNRFRNVDLYKVQTNKQTFIFIDKIYMRAVHKETELFLFLIYCFTYNLIKLVSFRVLSSTLDTPLPFFAVLERILECVLRDSAKVPCRIFFYLLYRLKSATF